MEFPNNIPTGGTAFTLLDHFLVFAHEDAQLGEIPCTVHLQAGLEEPYYETEIDVNITISLDQYRFEFPTKWYDLKIITYDCRFIWKWNERGICWSRKW